MSAFIWNIAHFTVQNSENVVKADISKNPCNGEMKKGCKV